MKRESGETPEQTRCCKLHQKSLNNTQNHCSLAEWEGRFKDGASQKTCQDNYICFSFRGKGQKTIWWDI